MRINEDAECVPCEPYTVPDDADQYRSCKSPSCEPREILTLGYDGHHFGLICSACGDYTVPDADQLNCVDPVCAARDIVEIDGSCTTCEDYLMVSNDRRECIQPTCPQRHVIPHFISTLMDCVWCEPHTVSSEDQLSCVAPECGPTERILRDGVCMECPSHTMPSENQIDCHAEECGEREILLENGQCEPCPAFQRA